MVLKEYRCNEAECGGDFTSLVAVCPRCGSKSVRRVFLTPPGINGGRTKSGSAKRIDKMLENEFAAQGISDFSSTGGESKVRYARRVQQLGTGVYATAKYGLAQPPIRAFVSKAGDFGPLEKAGEYGFSRGALAKELPWAGATQSSPESLPTVDQGSGNPVPDMVTIARSTELPKTLAQRSRIIRR